MTAVVVALMSLGLAVAVGYPLWKGVRQDNLPPFVAELIVQDGVAYTDPGELALDRALGRVGGESEASAAICVDLEDELERRVAALRQPVSSRPAAAPEPPVVATISQNCPRCGHAYDLGDAFCVRCGVSLAQVCPNCGRRYDREDLFCSRCGQKL